MFALFALLLPITMEDPAPYVVTTEKAKLPEAIPEAIRKTLAPTAIVLKDDKATVMSIWLVAETPTKATADQVKNGLTLRELNEGSLIGVVQFDSAFTDFRKQEVKAGVYTLRLGFQPETGDHMGTAPHTEFLLLTAIMEDTTAETLELKSVVTASKKINNDHPTVMLLYPAKADAKAGVLVSKGETVWAMNLAITAKANDETVKLNTAIVVKGNSKTR